MNIGALIAGVLADTFDLNATVVAVLTAASGLLAARWITEHHMTPPTDETGTLEGQ